MANCRYCSKPIVWVTTISGRKIALDPEPGWKGRYVVFEGQTGRRFAKIVPGRPTEPNRYAYHICSETSEPGGREMRRAR